jgi:hypothetical protein
MAKCKGIANRGQFAITQDAAKDDGARYHSENAYEQQRKSDDEASSFRNY